MHLYCKDKKIEGDGLMSLLMPIIGCFVQNLLNKEILVPVYGMKVDVFFSWILKICPKKFVDFAD